LFLWRLLAGWRGFARDEQRPVVHLREDRRVPALHVGVDANANGPSSKGRSSRLK
jgi:hypothetical protein